MRYLIATALWLTACAAGGLKPTLTTSPPSYLRSFPLASLTEFDLVAQAGPPNSTLEIAGKKAFVYRLGEDFGARTFTYTFDNGVVTDVIYNDNGPYNGSRASGMQGQGK